MACVLWVAIAAVVIWLWSLNWPIRLDLRVRWEPSLRSRHRGHGGLPPVGPADKALFVQIAPSGTAFAFKDKPWQTVGVNCYYLMTKAADASTRPALAALLDQIAASGMSVVRTWAFNDGSQQWNALQTAPGVWSEKVFVGLDWVVAECKARGLRLLLSLLNYWTDYGGIQQYVRWSRGLGKDASPTPEAFYQDSAAQDMFRQHMIAVLYRTNTFTGLTYNTDPTIFAWELINEPRCESKSGVDPAAMRGWMAQGVGQLKAMAPHQLVTVGTEGYFGESAPAGVYSVDNVGSTAGCDWMAEGALPGLDFLSIHLYPDHWLPSSSTPQQVMDFTRTWLTTHVHKARDVLHKPLMLTEFGTRPLVMVPHTGGTTESPTCVAKIEPPAATPAQQAPLPAPPPPAPPQQPPPPPPTPPQQLPQPPLPLPSQPLPQPPVPPAPPPTLSPEQQLSQQTTLVIPVYTVPVPQPQPSKAQRATNPAPPASPPLPAPAPTVAAQQGTAQHPAFTVRSHMASTPVVVQLQPAAMPAQPPPPLPQPPVQPPLPPPQQPPTVVLPVVVMPVVAGMPTARYSSTAKDRAPQPRKVAQSPSHSQPRVTLKRLANTTHATRSPPVPPTPQSPGGPSKLPAGGGTMTREQYMIATLDMIFGGDGGYSGALVWMVAGPEYADYDCFTVYPPTAVQAQSGGRAADNTWQVLSHQARKLMTAGAP